jgi:hypothetical protein
MRRSRLPAQERPSDIIFSLSLSLCNCILHVLAVPSNPRVRHFFTLATSCPHRSAYCAINSSRCWPLIAHHYFSTCDHQNANTSSGCRLGLFTRNSTFAVAPTCAHPAVTVAPRHRLFAARHQSTILISSFHWLLACASVSHLALPPASTAVPR